MLLWKFNSKVIGTFSPHDCLIGHIFCAILKTDSAFFRSRSMSVSSFTFMLKCIFVKISLSSPSALIFRVDLVSRFLRFNLEFRAIRRNNVFMHEAKDAAKISSGTQYPSLPPNSGGGLTVVMCLPFTVTSHSVPLFQLAVPSKVNSGME